MTEELTEQGCNHLSAIAHTSFSAGRPRIIASGKAILEASKSASDKSLDGYACHVTLGRCDCGELVLFAQINEDKIPILKGWALWPTPLTPMS